MKDSDRQYYLNAVERLEKTRMVVYLSCFMPIGGVVVHILLGPIDVYGLTCILGALMCKIVRSFEREETRDLDFISRELHLNLTIGEIIYRRKAQQFDVATISLWTGLAVYWILSVVLNFVVVDNSLLFSLLLMISLIVLMLILDIISFLYRVKYRFYGTNEREAREIIEFIRRESENIDFTDGGNLKKIFGDQDLQEFQELVSKAAPGLASELG